MGTARDHERGASAGLQWEGSGAVTAFAGIIGRMVGGTFGALAIALVAIPGGVAAGYVDGGLAALRT